MHFIPTFWKSQQLHFSIDIVLSFFSVVKEHKKDTFVHSSKLGNLVCFCVPRRQKEVREARPKGLL